jgi:hypothetical protein
MQENHFRNLRLKFCLWPLGALETRPPTAKPRVAAAAVYSESGLWRLAVYSLPIHGDSYKVTVSCLQPEESQEA